MFESVSDREFLITVGEQREKESGTRERLMKKFIRVPRYFSRENNGKGKGLELALAVFP